MLVDFFLHLKAAKLPVSTREFLTLLEAMEQSVVSNSIDDFYFLARTCLVKDEALYDRFNLAFGLTRSRRQTSESLARYSWGRVSRRACPATHDRAVAERTRSCDLLRVPALSRLVIRSMPTSCSTWKAHASKAAAISGSREYWS